MNKILIADDHVLVRLGMELLVKEVLGSACAIDFASDGSELSEKLEKNEYQILISDLNMPGITGLEMVANALKLQNTLRILLVSVNPELMFAHRYLKAGVFGYIQKGNSHEELKKAIYEISMGRRYLTNSQTRQFTNAFLNDFPSNPFDILSARELEVALLLLKGNGALEVSTTLSINPSTASTYRGRIFDKLGIKNIIELSQLARQYHFLGDDSM
ncbi:response regulator [Dyadobacter sp. LHD-138]|uniref:response regulator n=1 Tax=Dyadobacter sp. LHD-138 TaxID=3071413 RepID=UPI0027E1C673|nr:response regulator [Dyadobacter sp. LHD-138]MDQ6480631.1 response regulator [Dyadobacter sp. LHD-138]